MRRSISATACGAPAHQRVGVRRLRLHRRKGERLWLQPDRRQPLDLRSGDRRRACSPSPRTRTGIWHGSASACRFQAHRPPDADRRSRLGAVGARSIPRHPLAAHRHDGRQLRGSDPADRVGQRLPARSVARLSGVGLLQHRRRRTLLALRCRAASAISNRPSSDRPTRCRSRWTSPASATASSCRARTSSARCRWSACRRARPDLAQIGAARRRAADRIADRGIDGAVENRAAADVSSAGNAHGSTNSRGQLLLMRLLLNHGLPPGYPCS